MEGKRIKWGNIIIVLLIIAAGIAAFNYRGSGSNGGIFGFFSNGDKDKKGDQSLNSDQSDNNDNQKDNSKGNGNNVDSSSSDFIMGLDSWIGGTPILVGLSREYNRDYSLSMDVKYIPSDNDRIEALNKGEIQATEMSLPAFMKFQAKYPDAGVIVGITDFSRGADGIVAKAEVKDLNDMEGRKVSFVADGTGKFILNKFLRLVGLRYQDIEPIEREDMSQVIEDLKSGNADLIVSWSPDMNIAVNEINAANPGSVKVLITTKEVPDLVPTMLVVNKDYAQNNAGKVESFIKTWYAASKYVIEKPDKAYEKLAELMTEKGEYGEVAKKDVEASFKDIKLMSLNDNLSYFGVNGNENKLDGIINDTVETWKRYGDIDLNFNLSQEVSSKGYLGNVKNSEGIEELLVGAVDSEISGSASQAEEKKKEFKQQDAQSIEKNTERVAKVDIPPVYYDSGKATVKAESIAVLNQVKEMLSQFPEYYLIIDAHTDTVGNNENNLKLSKDRADEVKKYLVQKGVDEKRIIARGWGEDRPIVPKESTEGDKAKNRRTEFILTREIG
ncbi:phosphate ABC transporter substrate-binding/OmpA family protein [Acetivibrio cellulolyticus]|uniref:phosphate ABC transporter substrate-binding/OmpA family protein n=1 Tax=Acetivibrio cellulolyticus TaxID=35830 RepID=UPI0001E2E753|nr:phosphate ABC transporter substrate-binding/OmpA family protein [Acetivibrio cellulolyticus]